MNDYTNFKCRFLTPSQIRKIANDFRTKYWNDNILPVDMERIIGQRLKLDIIPNHDIRKLTKTDAYLQSDLSAIVVDFDQYMDDQDRYSNRLRFFFFYEIGYYVLHRSIYSQLTLDTLDQYCDFIDNFPEDEYEDFEWQANEFAGSLLVPRNRLMLEIQNIFEYIKENNIQEYLYDYPKDILARVSRKLCRPFGVSAEVIIRRVEIENLWPPI